MLEAKTIGTLAPESCTPQLAHTRKAHEAQGLAPVVSVVLPFLQGDRQGFGSPFVLSTEHL